MGNGVGRASKSVVRKGDFYPNLLEIERARREVGHHAIYTTEKQKQPFEIQA
jgi:hypothetical protein